MEDEKKESKFNFNLENCKEITFANTINTLNIYTGTEPENQEPEQFPFAKAIPESLRTGLLLIAWNKLREGKLLKEDYTLNTTQGGAKYIAMKISEMHNRSLPDDQDKKNEWRPFELLWGIKKNNLKAKDNPGEDVQAQIDRIFNSI